MQTGIGRTGAWFAHQLLDGIEPDVVTLAKGLGGGIPIGATVARGAAATLLQPGNHGTTFGGNPVACAAALAVLDTIEADDLLAATRARGDQLAALLTQQTGVVEVTGAGLMRGAELDGPYAAARRGRGPRRRLHPQRHRPDAAALRPAAGDHRRRPRRARPPPSRTSSTTPAPQPPRRRTA